MRAAILATFFLLTFFSLQAQSTYFQQGVDYQIDVTLNDNSHKLQGNIVMNYTNNSPDDLDFIYIHLWPNAYKNKKTAFAKQQLRTGSSRFYFADKKNLGHIGGLKFLVEGKPTHTLAIVKEHFSFYGAIRQNKLKRLGNELGNMPGVINKSIVFEYYLKKKRTFTEIIK